MSKPTLADVRQAAASLEFQVRSDTEAGTIDLHKISDPTLGGFFQDSQAGIEAAHDYLEHYRETLRKFDQARAKK